MSQARHLVALALPFIVLIASMARTSHAQLAGVDLSALGGGLGGGALGGGALGGGLGGGALGGGLGGAVLGGGLGSGLGSGGVAANIPGVGALDSLGTGDTIANVLSTMGVNQGVIDAIVAPISTSREAANTVRDMLTSNAANRREAISNTMAQIATPTQAISAFNDLMNGAFTNAASQLTDRMFPRMAGGTGGLFRSAGQDDANNTFIGALIGLPANPAALAGFQAGAGLPPVATATPADLAKFGTQLYGDITKQYNAAAKFQQEVAKKQKSEKKLKEACVQYALSEFLRGFASTLLTFGLPAGAIFSVLGEFAGLGTTGLTVNGAAYMNAYCCDMVRASGITGINFGTDGTVNIGPIGVDLGALLDAIPGAGAAADVATTAANTALTALTGGIVNGAAGGNLGLQSCNVFDWLAFALQGDKKLAKTFNDLLINAMKLEARLFSDALNGASRAAGIATRLVGRVAGGAGGALAAGGDGALAGLLGAVAGR